MSTDALHSEVDELKALLPKHLIVYQFSDEERKLTQGETSVADQVTNFFLLIILRLG